jgi:hypothetical protein
MHVEEADMADKRTKSVTTKLTEHEYIALAPLAGTQTVSAWARAVLLEAAFPNPAEPIILAEVLALRMILLNLHFAICGGEPATAETLHRLIARADQDKHRMAQAKLKALGNGRPS